MQILPLNNNHANLTFSPNRYFFKDLFPFFGHIEVNNQGFIVTKTFINGFNVGQDTGYLKILPCLLYVFITVYQISTWLT